MKNTMKSSNTRRKLVAESFCRNFGLGPPFSPLPYVSLRAAGGQESVCEVLGIQSQDTEIVCLLVIGPSVWLGMAG